MMVNIDAAWIGGGAGCASGDVDGSAALAAATPTQVMKSRREWVQDVDEQRDNA